MFNPQFSSERKDRYDDLRLRPHSSAVNTGMPFQRQDSLAICATLQEQDRERSSMLDFMETSLDLDHYLECFERDLNVPGDQVELDDNELQKAHILYDDNTFGGENSVFCREDKTQRFAQQGALEPEYDVFGTQDEDEYVMQCDVPHNKQNETTVIKARPARTIKRPSHLEEPNFLKTEPIDDWDDSASNSSYMSEKKSRASSKQSDIGTFKPQTKARKYNLKPDEERLQPQYRLKRARNNDAVRKSRNKAKEAQKKRDSDNDSMKVRIRELEALLEAEKKARSTDRQLIEELLKDRICVCDARRQFSR